MWLIIPKPGKIRIYTSGCPKNPSFNPLITYVPIAGVKHFFSIQHQKNIYNLEFKPSYKRSTVHQAAHRIEIL
jgi:hypothetical protein